MTICSLGLLDFNQKVGSLLLFHAKELLHIFDEALLQVQKILLENPKFQRNRPRKNTKRRVGSTAVISSSPDDSTIFSTQESEDTSIAPSLKPLCHIRIANLPPGLVRKNVSQIRSDDYGQFVQVSGTTIRTGKVKMLELEKEYRCSYKRCGYTFRVMADLEQGGVVEMPKRCPSGEFMPTGQKKCKSTRFEEVDGSCVCSDYQEIRIQEQSKNLGVGSIPRQISVVLQHDLVDTCKAGDEAVISGVVLRRWSPLYDQARCNIELVLLANSVQVHNGAGGDIGGTTEAEEEIDEDFRHFWSQHGQSPLRARNRIVRSFCPQLYSMFVAKLAVTLVLLGGVGRSQKSEALRGGHRSRRRGRRGRGRRRSQGGAGASMESADNDDDDAKRRTTRTLRGDAPRRAIDESRANGEKNCRRGEAHLLLVGDPGTGKSQLLRYASKLSPRAVMTTGTGTTSAGLTCSAVKDGGEWMLEGGALVLADRGLCCIDEFGNIRESDRATIHEAMEQQTLSVAKAGLVCKLNTRCAVMAVTNPKGKYDTSQDVSVNTAIASPLLSRFDIVLVLLDVVDETWDRKVSSFILESAMTKQGEETKKSVASSQSSCESALSAALAELWPMKRLRAYFQWARHRFMPQLTSDAQTILKAYYQKQRRVERYDRDAARTTIRLLESLVRLAQAHARLVAHDEADLTDAVVAVTMVEASTNSLNVLPNTSILHQDFPDDPDEAQREQNTKVLHALDLLHLLDRGSDQACGRRSREEGPTGVRPSQWKSPSPAGPATAPGAKKRGPASLFAVRDAPPQSARASKRPRGRGGI